MAKKRVVPFQARQGDVFLVRVNDIPVGATPRARANGRVILAYGEVTGHAHAIADTVDAPAAAIYEVEGEEGFYLRVESATGLVHDEHARIDLAPGSYRVVTQREYSPEAIRNVAD